MKGNIIFLKGKNAAGNLVFYTRAGEQIARARPEFVNDPKTANQTLARKRMAFISAMAKGLDIALDLGFADKVDGLHSSRNFFVKANYGKMTGTAEDIQIDYETLQLTSANSDVEVVALGELDTSVPLTLSVPTDDGYSDSPTAKATDKGMIVVYSKTAHRAMTAEISNVRTEDTSWSVRVPSNWQGHFVEVYAFVFRGEGKDAIASETLYCGTGRVA